MHADEQDAGFVGHELGLLSRARLEQPGAQRQGHVDQPDQHGHFDQWSDDPGQGLPGRDAVGGNRHRDGQFEIVSGGSERQGGGAGIAEPQYESKGVSASPHDREVGQQRNGDPGDIPWPGGDLVALQGEQDDDGEQQPIQCPRPDAGQKPVSYQWRPLARSPSRRDRYPASSGRRGR